MTAVKKAPRRLERICAFKMLYSICFTPVDTLEDLRSRFDALPDKPEQGGLAFAWELIAGTWKNQQAVDASITRFSQNWRIERMAKVELTILRLCMFELLFRNDVPARVALNEAIELSKQFGDEKSRSFVNGILDAAVKAVDAGSLQRQSPPNASVQA